MPKLPAPTALDPRARRNLKHLDLKRVHDEERSAKPSRTGDPQVTPILKFLEVLQLSNIIRKLQKRFETLLRASECILRIRI